MKTLVALLICFASACERPDSTLTVTLSPERLEMRDKNIAYQGNGTFTVHVTAVSDHEAVDMNLRALSAELTVAADTGSTPAPSKVMLLRSDEDPHTFEGAAMLAWPLGGPVVVIARVAGIQGQLRLTIDQPRMTLAIAPDAPDPGTGTSSVQFCVVSSARAGTVAVHLENATFTGTTTTDTMLALTRGDCPVDAAVPLTKDVPPESHATLSLTTKSANPSIAATLPSATAGATPLDFLAAHTISVEIPAAVARLELTAPASARTGTVVTAQARASTAMGGPVKGVIVAFSASAEVTFITATASTDTDGQATTQFVMPELDGGALLVHVAGGQRQDTATITTAP